MLVKARNCLVFQGDVQAVALKTPTVNAPITGNSSSAPLEIVRINLAIVMRMNLCLAGSHRDGRAAFWLC